MTEDKKFSKTSLAQLARKAAEREVLARTDTCVPAEEIKKAIRHHRVRLGLSPEPQPSHSNVKAMQNEIAELRQQLAELKGRQLAELKDFKGVTL